MCNVLARVRDIQRKGSKTGMKKVRDAPNGLLEQGVSAMDSIPTSTVF